MNSKKQDLTLGEVALSFLASLPPEQREKSQQEITRFILWYGKERAIVNLTAPEVDDYAKSVAASSSDPSEKLTPVRAFLSYAKKEGFTQTNLATHLKVKKGSPKRP